MMDSRSKKARRSESGRARGEGMRGLFRADTANGVLQCVAREGHELAVAEVDSRTLGFDLQDRGVTAAEP
ncbi:hypothetical protein WT56_32555 [Burkholderia pseudomultivorans]|uniref:Uncharacterized protein n=1 Tax=Burkholderia pseudomultivorans TaxID=1207504 RepID=A0A132E5W3_9BURK|nr:hypothetical protein WT56_32555 [Burkholderia pseudomultivorans]